MKIRKLEKSALELMSLEDIAYQLIKEDKSAKTTPELFKEICNLLELGDEEYKNQIADFFTSLTIDKRFVLLNSTNWDLRENHAVKIVVADEDDTDEIEEEEETEKYNNEDELYQEQSMDIEEVELELDVDVEEEFDELEDMDIVEEDATLEE